MYVLVQIFNQGSLECSAHNQGAWRVPVACERLALPSGQRRPFDDV